MREPFRRVRKPRTAEESQLKLKTVWSRRLILSFRSSSSVAPRSKRGRERESEAGSEREEEREGERAGRA